MKAQSELAGDRKKRAEMSRSRFRGVTGWITGITETTHKLMGTFENVEIPKIEISPKLREVIRSLNESYNNEVIYRPAGQQWPVRTP